MLRKDSTWMRVILDLLPLNKFIQCPHFRMVTISDVRRALPRQGFTISIDIKDAYWHVPMLKKASSYMGFQLGDQIYKFKAMPFGLNIAPRIFTKLMDQAIAQLRLQGVSILAYLDDLLVWGDTVENLKKDVDITLGYLRYLGWTINLAKSRLEPQHQFEYLGLEWDLVDYSLTVPKTKVNNCLLKIDQLLKS